MLRASPLARDLVESFSLRPLSICDDIEIIHRWVADKRAHYWGMVGASKREVAEAYTKICEPEHVDVYVGLFRGEPAFLLETYDPRHDRLALVYPVEPGDRGMHVLLAPAEAPIHGFTSSVFRVILDHMFSDPQVQRIVVEPDVRNQAIRRRNVEAGFVELGTVQLPDHADLPKKSAMLSICLREAVTTRTAEGGSSEVATGLAEHNRVDRMEASVARNIDRSMWALATRKLVAKAIGELAHECIVKPKATTNGEYEIASEKEDVAYRFTAKRYGLNHWVVAPSSIQRRCKGRVSSLGGQQLILDFRTSLGIPDDKIVTYLEEINATLLKDTYMLSNERWDASSLVHAGMQAIEASMTAGHPCFIANNARIGFDERERIDYSPEQGEDVRLIWVAVHKQQGRFWSITDEKQEDFLVSELPDSDRILFQRILMSHDVDPSEYLWIPVHPWQWNNRIVTMYAAELADKSMIYLGCGSDSYQPQQSIRTLFNRVDSTRHYVKCALSILNMGFYRGLSSRYMSVTPAINQWVHQIVGQDATLAKHGFGVLREVAAVGVHQPLLAEVAPEGHQAHKLLAALWRENPMAKVGAGQSLATMASLLHVDNAHTPFVTALIQDSGLQSEEWVRRYLRAYLVPVIHCFYAYNMVFMPHGENIILVLENSVPVGAFIKDIGEEVALFRRPEDLPDEINRMVVDMREDLRLLSIFTDVFDCFFRFLVPILDEHGGLRESRFWSLVAEEVHEYQDDHPELRSAFDRYDIFSPRFALCCMNRLQFTNNEQLVDLADPASTYQLVGDLLNPLAAHSRDRLG